MHPFAFVGRYDGDSSAFQTFSAAAACTVQVVGRFFGNIQIDDMSNAFDIQTTGADIRCYQHIDAAFAETIHGILSVHLARLTIDTISFYAMVAQFFHCYFNIFRVIQENHCFRRFFPCNDFTQVQEFFSMGGKDIVMFDTLRHYTAAFRFQIDMIFLHHANGFFLCFTADRSGQQHDLSVTQCCFYNCFHIFHIAVIHQSVAFIQNDRFYQMSLNFFLSDEVKDTTYRTHNDTGFGFQFFHLSADACRTDQQSAAHVHTAVFLQQFRLMEHLHRQFMGRCQDDSLCTFHIHIDFFKNGQQICQCFTRACFGTANDIFAFHHRRDHFFLNLCGIFNSLSSQRTN